MQGGRTDRDVLAGVDDAMRVEALGERMAAMVRRMAATPGWAADPLILVISREERRALADAAARPTPSAGPAAPPSRSHPDR